MDNFIRIGRIFFGTGIIGLGIQHFYHKAFRPFILDHWPSSLPDQTLFAYIMGAVLILAAIFIISGKKGWAVSVVLGLLFFLLFLCFHFFRQLSTSMNNFQLGAWINPLKELAFAGGAFIMAASFTDHKSPAINKPLLIIGRVFFSIMLITFGISHFVYLEFVQTLVPDWIPGHLFWSYFGAVALIGSGLCLLLKIQIRLVSILLGTMLFLWVVLLHIPRALKAPDTDNGNELTSVFQALAFSGIAFVIAGIYKTRASVRRS